MIWFSIILLAGVVVFVGYMMSQAILEVAEAIKKHK